MTQYPQRYFGARFFSLVVDLAIGAIWSFLAMGVWNAPSLWASMTETIRIEAEQFEGTNYSKLAMSHASGGEVRRTPRQGTLNSKFEGPSSVYDVILGMWDRRIGDSKLDFQIGHHSFSTTMSDGEDAFVHKIVQRKIEVTNGDRILITAYADKSDMATIDFVEFVPEGSIAFRPNGTERTYPYGHLLKAIDYDEMNVHISLLKAPIALVLLQLISFSFVPWTPGRILLDLRAASAIHPPGIKFAVLRLLGNLFSLIFLGIGWIWPLFSTYKQSWADILSHSFIITRSMGNPGIFEHSDSISVFASASGSLGSFNEVPWEHRLCATCLDILFLLTLVGASFGLYHFDEMKLYLFDTIRIEAESLDLDGFRAIPSIWNSSLSYINNPGGLNIAYAKGQFSGPPGDYRVVVTLSGNDNKDHQLKIGDYSQTAEIDLEKGLFRRFPFFMNIPVSTGDPIELSIRGSGHKVDSIDFIPTKLPNTYWYEENVFRGGKLLDVIGSLSPQTGAYYIVILILSYVLYYSLCIGHTTYTIGSFLVGYKTVQSETRHTAIGFKLALFETVKPVLYMLAFLVELILTTQATAKLKQPSVKLRFSK